VKIGLFDGFQIVMPKHSWYMLGFKESFCKPGLF